MASGVTSSQKLHPPFQPHAQQFAARRSLKCTLSSSAVGHSLLGLPERGRAGLHACSLNSKRQRYQQSDILQPHSFQACRLPRHSGSTLRRHAAPHAAADASAGAFGSPQVQAEPLPAKRVGSLAKRVASASVMVALGAVIILSGGWLFTAATCLATYQASQEYYGFVTSKGISEGMKPPPPAVSALTSLMCISLTVWTYLSAGRSTAALAVSSFAVLSLQLVAVDKPRFAQLASSVFGLFYCGYLPSFWVKLRLLGPPAIHSTVVQSWPVMLGGISQWTVGLIATIMAVACVIAADTGAYFFGKSLGRTQLTSISPKKTVEGAAGGFLCSVAAAVGLWRVFAWPASGWAAAGLGSLAFFASLFGDLIESVMKRDAGLKDASDLIPGHGGLLDRFDSYIFTGAIVYFHIKFVLPYFGL